MKTKTHGILRRSGETRAPLSFAQQRLWFLHQMAPQSAVYNVPAALCLEGVLNSSALEQAFSEILRCHEVLRTTFDTVDSEPVQVISPPYRVVLPIVDLKALAKTEQVARVRQLAVEEARRPFDLERGPSRNSHPGDGATPDRLDEPVLTWLLDEIEGFLDEEAAMLLNRPQS